MKFEEAVYEFVVKGVLRNPYFSGSFAWDLTDLERELFIND